MEVYQIRSLTMNLKDFLRQNNALLEDVDSVYVDVNYNYVVTLKPRFIDVKNKSYIKQKRRDYEEL
jgi:hypothetical protein